MCLQLNTVRLVAMKTALGELRSTQDHAKEHQTHYSGTLSGENSAQISFAWFGEGILTQFPPVPSVPLETAVKGLN